MRESGWPKVTLVLCSRSRKTRHKAVNLLKAKYSATVKVLEEEGRFKGLFFVTPEMKNAMTAWPEIVFIDGTYKLLKMGFTVMLLIVQDSNALSAVVGVGLLASEDRTTFNWFLESFKSINNEACFRMQCVMGDKDLLERDVLKEVFPGVPIYICRFHTLRTFSRVISTEKMKISKAERATSLEILQKLVFSSSEAVYETLYANFCESVPSCVREYFDKNWHPIRGDWTTYSMVHGNLNNMTNNRLESMNAKIKQVVEKNSSLVSFIRRFFSWMHSHNHEVDAKTAIAFLKRPVESLEEGTDEQKYRDLLMPPSFAIVSKQLKQSRYISNIVCIDRSKHQCLIRQNNTELNVTPLSCECSVWTSTFVPCRHIFGTRRYFKLPLFAQQLCQPRCTKEYVVRNQRAFASNQLSTVEPSHPSPMVTRVASRKPITVPQKRKLVIPIANELVQLASAACGSRFDGRKELLQQICDSWRQGSEVQIKPDSVKENGINGVAGCENTEKSEPVCGLGSQYNSNLVELLDAQCIIDDRTSEKKSDALTTEDSVLSSIKMPPPIKIIGRPSGNLSTTCRITRRKNSSNIRKKT